MRRRTWALGLAVSVAAVALVATIVPRTGGKRRISGPDTELRVTASRTNPMGYVAFLPPGYSTSKSTVPTIVYLHGAGERGDGDAASLYLSLSAGLPRLADTDTLPSTARKFIILAPQTDAEFFDPAQIHTWLASVSRRFRIDHKRMYLTGISMGGEGVFDYLNRYGDANEFAAMAPIAGAFQPLPVPDGLPACDRMANTPLWAFHGAKDDVQSAQESRDLVGYVNSHCHPREPLRLTIYLNAEHDSWTRTYDLAGMHNDPLDPNWQPYRTDLYSWFLQHSRTQRPT